MITLEARGKSSLVPRQLPHFQFSVGIIEIAGVAWG